MVYIINGCREYDYKFCNIDIWRMIRLKRGFRKFFYKIWIEYKFRIYGICIGYRYLEYGYGII